MKMAGVADPSRREEISQRKVAGDVEWTWFDSVEEMAQSGPRDAYFDLEFHPDAQRTATLAVLLPSPVFIDAVPYSLQAIGQPFVRICGWPGFTGRPILEIAATQDSLPAAGTLLRTLGWDYQVVPDLPGMVSPRIVSMIINEAYHTLGAGVSTREDIDRAMKLGTNYPFGPFEWAGKIGLARIYELLRVLSEKDERYDISETLVRELQGAS